MGARTERLYHRDASLTRFEATILAVGSDDEEAGAEGRIAVLLDRTAFYPTGGGQPHDTGLMAGLPVVEVREGPEGPIHIVQITEGTAAPAALCQGRRIECRVDAGRRLDHMQHHSGQHILTRAFLEVASAPTRSFHLGEAICTLDVGLPVPTEEVVRAAERRANEVIWEDRPVTVREAAGEPSGGGGLPDPRTSGLALKPGDPVRYIDVAGFDSTPCGGTHVGRTGQIGILCVTGWEAYKRMCRVTFLCGGRVARHVRETGAILSRCVAGLSAPPPELAGALERVLRERDDLRKRLKSSRRELAGYEATALAGGAVRLGPFRLVLRTYDAADRSAEDAETLAREIAALPGMVALLAVKEKEGATILAARTRGPGPDLGRAVGRACLEAGGRGGGSPEIARGGGVARERAASVLQRIAEALSEGPAGPPGPREE